MFRGPELLLIEGRNYWIPPIITSPLPVATAAGMESPGVVGSFGPWEVPTQLTTFFGKTLGVVYVRDDAMLALIPSAIDYQATALA